MSNLPLNDQRNEQPANDAGYTALMAVKPGERLREARNKRKLDLEAAAEQLNLSVSVISALEEDDYQALPSSTFIKGYIRSYARMLRLPSDELVRAYEYQTGVHSSMDEQHPIPDGPVKKSNGILLVILVLVLVLVGIGWLLFGGADSEQAQSPQETSAGGSSAPSAANEEPSAANEEPSALTKPSATTQPASTIVPPSQKPSEASDVPAAPSPKSELQQIPIEIRSTSNSVKDDKPKAINPEVVATAPQPATPPAEVIRQVSSPFEPRSAAETTGLLTVSFTDDCWVEIRNQQGKLIHADLHRAGSEYQANLPKPFNIKLGNGKAAKLSYNGAPVDFALSKRSNVAYLDIGQ